MKILVPFTRGKNLERFVKAGADEFYLGFHDPFWQKKYGKYSDLNRMTGFGSIANKYNFQEMLDIVWDIYRAGRSAFITLNANAYSADQIDYIRKHYLPGLRENGAAGVIVSELNLARAVAESGLTPVASTMCGIYNEDIARCYFDAGVKRLIVPRDLSLEEIDSIMQAVPEADFEVFFMRNGCMFSDCYCLGTHRNECGATCSFMSRHPKRFITRAKSFEDRQKVDSNNILYNEVFHKETCGLCALYRLGEMGVGSLKIVGRSDDPDSIFRDIKLIRKNMEIADRAANEQEYLDNMVFPDNAFEKCVNGLSCYYPEVRFGKNRISSGESKLF